MFGLLFCKVYVHVHKSHSQTQKKTTHSNSLKLTQTQKKMSEIIKKRKPESEVEDNTTKRVSVRMLDLT
jgi:ribosomal protein L44E